MDKQEEYAKLSSLLVKGRMAGIIDWEAIEDRIRIPYLPYYAENPADAINDIIYSYRLDRQEGQDVYIWLAIEKDALSGVLKPITSYYHVNLIVNRGYSSCTAIYDMYNKFISYLSQGKRVVLLYLGDHDPSGLDMVRDIKERLIEMFMNSDELFSIEHIALIMDQIKQYNLPAKPAKITDPRAKWYIQKHGQVSWEVDALDPKILSALVKKSIESIIDLDKFNKVLLQEEKDKRKLKKIAGVI